MRPTADTLTTLRFVLSPIVMWLILADEKTAALTFYGAAIVTDILDVSQPRAVNAAAESKSLEKRAPLPRRNWRY